MRIGLGLSISASRGRASAAVVPPPEPETGPAQMSAPTLGALGSEVTVTRAAAPADNGAPITSYDLRYSTDGATWATVTGIAAVRTLTGFADETACQVQTRAVNANGVGAWSASATITTGRVINTTPAGLSTFLATAKPGDDYVVANGTRTTDISIAASGTAAKPIRIRAATKHGAFFDTDAYAAIILTGNHLILDGLRVRNYSRHGIEAQYGHHITVRNCWLHDCGGNGFGALQGDFYRIENNLSENNGRTGWNSGISIYQPDHRGSGDTTTPGIERNIIRGNLVRGNHMSSFVMFAGGSSAITKGDVVTVGTSVGIADRVEVTSGSWATGNAAGRIGLLLRQFPGPDPVIGDAIVVGGTTRATVSVAGFQLDEGMFTDGNGIILDDWSWAQNSAAGYSYPYGALVENNIVHSNGGKGIQFYGVSGDPVARNNTLYANNLDAIMSTSTWRGDLSAQDSAPIFANNLVVCTPGPNVNAIGLYSGAAGKVAQLYNNLTFNGNDGVQSLFTESSTWTGSGNKFGVNPRLTDPDNGDFRPASNSAAVDAADETRAPSVDFAGTARMAGAINIGALEAVGPAYVPPARGTISDVGLSSIAYGQRTDTALPAISGLAAGDVVYAFERIYRVYDDTIAPVTPPSGFTQVYVSLMGLGNASGWVQTRIWRKIVQTGDPIIGGTMTFTHATAYSQFVAMALRGVDLTQPEDTLFFSTVTGGPVRTWPDLTTNTANARLIAAGADNGSGTAPCGLPKAGMTQHLDITLTYLASVAVPSPATITGLTNTANSQGSGDTLEANIGTVFAVRAATL